MFSQRMIGDDVLQKCMLGIGRVIHATDDEDGIVGCHRCARQALLRPVDVLLRGINDHSRSHAIPRLQSSSSNTSRLVRG